MVAKGETVKIHYRGTLRDGREFDSSYRYGAPLDFVVGEQEMAPGFEEAILSMEVGDVRTIVVPAEEAYGLYDETLIETVPVESFPNAEKLPVGSFITIKLPEGNAVTKVVKIEDGLIYFDHNHELAGEDLLFEIRVISDEEASKTSFDPTTSFRSGGWKDFERVMGIK